MMVSLNVIWINSAVRSSMNDTICGEVSSGYSRDVCSALSTGRDTTELLFISLIRLELKEMKVLLSIVPRSVNALTMFKSSSDKYTVINVESSCEELAPESCCDTVTTEIF